MNTAERAMAKQAAKLGGFHFFEPHDQNIFDVTPALTAIRAVYPALLALACAASRAICWASWCRC